MWTSCLFAFGDGRCPARVADRLLGMTRYTDTDKKHGRPNAATAVKRLSVESNGMWHLPATFRVLLTSRLWPAHSEN